LKTIKHVANKSNLVVLTSLRKRYLGLFPKHRHPVEYGSEYSDRVYDALWIAKEIVHLALIDRCIKHLVMSLLNKTHNGMPFVLTPTGFMNSRRVLKQITEMIRIVPTGRILDQVLHKMSLCIQKKEAFPLHFQWAPNLRLKIAYERDLKDLRSRMRVMREADLARRKWVAVLRVADKFGLTAELVDHIASFIIREKVRN